VVVVVAGAQTYLPAGPLLLWQLWQQPWRTVLLATPVLLLLLLLLTLLLLLLLLLL
jgi:hypothetical protein